MADYYPVLARAVSRLQDNDARARQELYKRARTIADAQLLGQDLQRSAPQILRERASLEAAIRRVETEFLYLSSHSSTGPPAPRPSAAVADNGHDVGVRQKRSMRDEATARPPPAQYADRDTDTGKSPTTNVTANMSGIPESLAKMLFHLAFFVGMLAFIAVIYIRGLILVSERVIAYPVLLVVIALMVCLFIFLPLAIFRGVKIVPRMGLTSSALRRGF